MYVYPVFIECFTTSSVQEVFLKMIQPLSGEEKKLWIYGNIQYCDNLDVCVMYICGMYSTAYHSCKYEFSYLRVSW